MQWLALCLVLLFILPAHASVTVITDRQQWQNAVGSYSTIDFTGYPEFTVITTQYANQGVAFTDGNDHIHISPSFPSDGHGLHSSDGWGNDGTIHMSFDRTISWFAIDYIGALQLDLFHDGRLLFSSVNYLAGFTPFIGVVSTEPFDALVARDWIDDVVAIDDIHFGPPIPAPGALLTLGIGITMLSGRRRFQ